MTYHSLRTYELQGAGTGLSGQATTGASTPRSGVQLQAPTPREAATKAAVLEHLSQDLDGVLDS